MADKQHPLADLVQRLPVSRRGFISRVVGGAFVAPVVSSAAVATLFGSRGLAAYPASTGNPISTSPVPTGVFCSSPPFQSGPFTSDLTASADSFLRKNAQNTNEGANLRLSVGVAPVTRAVVQFDVNTINCQLVNARSIQLILTIATNHDTWGQQNPRSVVAHRLKCDFVEGNGIQALMPASLAQRGTGSGVTWRSPDDPDVANRKVDPRHHPVLWDGGDFGAATADPVPHQNQQTGTIAFDVTADVLDHVASGWLLKIDNEEVNDGDDDGNRPAGDEPRRGCVEYYSVQGASNQNDMTLAPTLRFFY
jgi:hypothetical protein